MIKCSKCGSVPSSYIETLQAIIDYGADDKGYPIDDGNIEPGNPIELEATCSKCKHVWKTRKSIMDLNDMKDKLTTH